MAVNINAEKIKSRALMLSAKILIVLLAISGFAQMPIFKRYYIAGIPGFSWTGDYYLTHNMHYISAVVLITLTVYVLVQYLIMPKENVSITLYGYAMIFVFTALVISGILKVVSSRHGVYFGRTTIIVLDIIHTSSTFLLLIYAGICKAAGIALTGYRWNK